MMKNITAVLLLTCLSGVVLAGNVPSGDAPNGNDQNGRSTTSGGPGHQPGGANTFEGFMDGLARALDTGQNLPSSEKYLPLPDRITFYDNNGQPKGNGRIEDLSYARLSSKSEQGAGMKEMPGPFPQEVFKYRNLQEINVEEAFLEGPVPEDLGNLTHLQRLILGKNAITSLPENIKKLKQLRILYAEHNQLETLPTGICDLSSLKVLNASNNHLKLMPPCLKRLNALEQLDVSHNQLKVTPDAMNGLKELRSVNLSHNKIRELNGAVGDVISLKSLDVSHNQLETLPRRIGTLEHMTSLKAHNNFITYLPDTLHDIKYLSILDLSHNRIVRLPRSFSELTGLTVLDLSHNRLKELPGKFENFENLSTVNLSHNHLSRVSLPGVKGSLSLFNNLLTIVLKEHDRPIFLAPSPNGVHIHFNATALSSDRNIWHALHAIVTDPTITAKRTDREILHPPIILSFIEYDASHPETFDRTHEVLRLSITPSLRETRNVIEQARYGNHVIDENAPRQITIEAFSPRLEEVTGMNQEAWKQKLDSIPFLEMVQESRMKSARSTVS